MNAMNMYNHVRCECGGFIGAYSRRRFTCEKCEKEYSLEELNYDVLLINKYTGWIFPMKFKEADV